MPGSREALQRDLLTLSGRINQLEGELRDTGHFFLQMGHRLITDPITAYEDFVRMTPERDYGLMAEMERLKRLHQQRADMEKQIAALPPDPAGAKTRKLG